MAHLFHKILCVGIRRYTDDCGNNLNMLPVLYTAKHLSSFLHRHKTEDIVPEEIVMACPDQKLPTSASSFQWLHSVAPFFTLDGEKVTVITEPSKFYETLLEKSKAAKRRITLASLYLGTGTLEKELVSAIAKNLEASSGNLKVKVLLDFSRGSRGNFNSRHMLLPLLEKHKKYCQVALYHTPALRGPLRRLLPPRYSELVGLQHMKIYLFDDSLLISGANLSNDYFTNRQDRYILVEDCRPLADFYDDLVERVSEFSLQLWPGNRIQLHHKWNIHPFKGRYEEFAAAARANIHNFLDNALHQAQQQSHNGDTCVFPLVEMGQLGVRQDSRVTLQLLKCAASGSTVHLATGYFNLTAQYMESIIHQSAAAYSVLMAHPTANGFLGAAGPAGGIPAAYRQLAAAFLHKVQNAGQEDRVSLLEYFRPEWTYHAKGLWYTLPLQNLPILTLVGSSNFGSRSVYKDLETQVVIVTTNKKLQKALKEEQEQLYSRGIPFTEKTVADSKQETALWVHTVVKLFRHYF
ncbi:CDP-diacylglycerol--glycerol-3-phosphate 3-phosphatidyltransferase, mitochondrial-like isoform X1 [Schistocerca gregaria]|uniref:CDP-diacylglycerol--glycerol-3-phosphate 3-phosphatidyltransferase, mitochondrial-like isoform X1 n=1 Tax=Schistocerca gregaria TaxID=7010 RepID=UPI00211E3CE0|nr:CDP-diacylglycerol--glycerol-3-phosphate 3-phosphatidyltransferase, mitochondrial-like isoform X1 [Schistocerca gregaria]